MFDVDDVGARRADHLRDAREHAGDVGNLDAHARDLAVALEGAQQDRRQQAPEWAGIDVDRPATAPERARDATPLESARAGLWSSVLGRDHIGRDDNFYLLGGDSMSPAELVRQVAAVFGVGLPLHAMFEGTATPAGMARAIERSRSGARP